MNYEQHQKPGRTRLVKRRREQDHLRQTRLSPHQIQTLEYRRLDLEQAHTLLPVVRKLTQQSALILAPLQTKLNNMVPADPRIQSIKHEYEQIVRHWSGKIERLGLSVQGLWRVGFDCGEGWYVWQLPERRIRYFLEYGQLFEEAVLIESLNHSDYSISVKNR